MIDVPLGPLHVNMEKFEILCHSDITSPMVHDQEVQVVPVICTKKRHREIEVNILVSLCKILHKIHNDLMLYYKVYIKQS